MQIYCLILFVYYSKRYYTNENISDANLLLDPFCLFIVKDEKKKFDALYKHHADIFVQVF